MSQSIIWIFKNSYLKKEEEKRFSVPNYSNTMYNIVFSCIKVPPILIKCDLLKQIIDDGTLKIINVRPYNCFPENKKANTGGVAYEVILKPAAADVPRPSSPPKDKAITHDDIVKKLQEAEERRLVIFLNFRTHYKISLQRLKTTCTKISS